MFSPRAVLPTIAVGCLGAVATMLALAHPADPQPSSKPAGTRARSRARSGLGAAEQDHNTTIKSNCTSRVTTRALGSLVRTNKDV